MGTLSSALAWATHVPRGSLDDPRDAFDRRRVAPLAPPRGLGEDLDKEVTKQMGALGTDPKVQHAYYFTLYQLADRPGLLRSFIHRVGQALELDQRV